MPAAIRTGPCRLMRRPGFAPGVRDPSLALYARLKESVTLVTKAATRPGLCCICATGWIWFIWAPAKAARTGLAAVVKVDRPRALPDALRIGLPWDAVGRRYDDLRACWTSRAGGGGRGGVM